MATQTASATGETGEVRVWDLPLRLFHWLLVAAIALAFLSSEEGSPLSDWHVLSGWVAAVLIAFRIVWGFVGGEHSRWADFVRPAGLAAHFRELARFRPAPTLGHNPLGALSVLVLLMLAAGVVWTGAALGEAGEEAHELLAWTLLALIALHVVAVVTMSLLTRENLVGAMVNGRKPTRRHPGAHDARRPPWYGFVLAALAVAGALYAVRSFDPLAFTPRSAESFEHRADAGPADAAGEQAERHEGPGNDD
jgi:cytochrome b